jgi:hypothetical protein
MILAFKARKHDPAIASFRYRVMAPIRFLGARGHAVEGYDEARFGAYDAVVFSKAYRPADQKIAQRLKAAGKRVVLDLCDDHFFNPAGDPAYREARAQLLAMIALADKVICSTPVLARAVQEEAGLPDTPAVAPDIYDQAPVRVGPPTPEGQPARLLWFGRHGSPNADAGMADLTRISDLLAEAHARRPLELTVCSDNEERFEALFQGYPVPVRYRRWTPEDFAAELGRTDAVVIPLSDNRFVAAKTHNRLSLALSAGVPVVADPIDSYEEFGPFCYLGRWREGLEAVLLRPEEARARAGGARAYLEANWSERAVAPQWEAALGLAGGASPGAVVVDPGPAVPLAGQWLRRERRNDRAWLVLGPAADIRALEPRDGELVMSLGAAALEATCDLACILDIEKLCEAAELLAARARWVLTPSVPHSHGWPVGRDLDSWSADVPVLRRLRAEGRLVRFDLWPGSPQGFIGPLDGPEVPLALLAEAGVRRVRYAGFSPRQPSASGFDGLSSILERTSGGLEALTGRRGVSYEPV